jgi:hypothetical protein
MMNCSALPGVPLDLFLFPGGRAAEVYFRKARRDPREPGNRKRRGPSSQPG